MRSRILRVDPRCRSSFTSSAASSWGCWWRPAEWRCVLGEHIEAVAILVVIVLNAAIGFLTEWKAEQALAALRKQTVPVAHVVRDGAEDEIPAAELVPGDLVVLAAGARVPADGRVVESVRLQVEEAALTGESLAVTQDDRPAAGQRMPRSATA